MDVADHLKKSKSKASSIYQPSSATLRSMDLWIQTNPTQPSPAQPNLQSYLHLWTLSAGILIAESVSYYIFFARDTKPI